MPWNWYAGGNGAVMASWENSMVGRTGPKSRTRHWGDARKAFLAGNDVGFRQTTFLMVEFALAGNTPDAAGGVLI